MPVASAGTVLPRAQRVRYAATALLPAIAVAILAGRITLLGADWYDGLTLPSFALPGWPFGMIGAGADLLMGFAFDRVLCRPDWMPDRSAAIRAFWIQLGLGLLWPLGFFGLRNAYAGLVIVLGLLAALAMAAHRFRRIDRVAGLCAALCGLWTLFAALVSLSIVIRN